MTRLGSTIRIAIAALVVGAGLVLVGWLDFRATRTELLALLGEQARALHQAIAAAARSNQAAGALAEAEIGARLLDNGRFLADLDRRRLLDQPALDAFAARNHLYRVTVFRADRTRELAGGSTMGAETGRGTAGGGGFGPGGGRGRGAGGARGGGGTPGGMRGAGGTPGAFSGQGFGPGRGLGLGPGAAGIVDEALASPDEEGLVPIRAAGSGVGTRQAAWVKRARGGVIVLNVDATGVSQLHEQSSLDALVEDIARSSAEVAYVVIDGPGVRVAHGAWPSDLQPGANEANAAVGAGITQREVRLDDGPVLEFSGAVPIGPDGQRTGHLHLGLHLDGVRRAQQRMLWRMSASLAAALALALLALGTIWLRQQLGIVSAKHARAEAALRRRDRLAAMGELASTVAHEVRNPLNGIAMAAQRIRREYGAELAAVPGADRDELAQLLGVLEGETRRIDTIVRQFLEFARPPKLAPQSVDLAAEVASATEAARPIAETRAVTIETATASARSAVLDPGQFRQALDNLVRNAVEATPEGGRVTITASSRSDGHEVAIADTGPGIPPDVLPRIFDLYFTTKADGTGVGLAVTQQIVAAHGGTIDVESAPGSGTRMIVRLPATVEEVDRA